MRILVQLGHPAQFHFFKNAMKEWKQHGHSVFVIIRTKDVLEDLIKATDFKYCNIEKKRLKKETKFQLIIVLVFRMVSLLYNYFKFKPTLILSPDPVFARLSRFLPVKFIAVGEDDYKVINTLADFLFPYVDHIIAPKVCDYSLWQYKKIEFDGYMKLAYLHPNRFVPDYSQISNYVHGENYVLIRIVSLTAHHDKGINGLSESVLSELIKIFELNGYEVFISSERHLSSTFNDYILKLPVSLIHHFMAFSSMIVCDSQSMAVEAAMLGVPSIRFNDFMGKISVLEELEHRFMLTFGISSTHPERLYEMVNEILLLENRKELFQQRKEEMLAEKIDVTAFLVWLVENYPHSATKVIQNPGYSRIFK